jgi:hypothetical protein
MPARADGHRRRLCQSMKGSGQGVDYRTLGALLSAFASPCQGECGTKGR